jgi:hypothetical protein
VSRSRTIPKSTGNGIRIDLKEFDSFDDRGTKEDHYDHMNDGCYPSETVNRGFDVNCLAPNPDCWKNQHDSSHDYDQGCELRKPSELD